MQLKSQLNVRIAPACVALIKLERRNIPGCASDGEALESIIFRAATSPEGALLELARQDFMDRYDEPTDEDLAPMTDEELAHLNAQTEEIVRKRKQQVQN